MMTWIQTIDWALLYWIHDTFSCEWLDWLMPKITALGNAGMIWIAIGVGLLCTKKYRTHGVLLLLALAVGFLTGNLLLKNLAARSRPCWLDQSVSLLISVPSDYSFPSGHTLSSVIAAVILSKTTRCIALPSAVLACLIAFSRLYLFVHFPSDVLFAALLGVIIGLAALRLGDAWQGRHQK